MIDLHSHVLAGIDDGPATMEGSVALAVEAENQGIEVLAATPHVRADHPLVRLDELAARCDELRRNLPSQIGLEIVPGAEVDLLWAQTASDEELRLASYAQQGQTLLVETPYGPLPPRFDDLMFILTVRGYRLVLAHPERNPTFQSDPKRLIELVGRGVVIQITAQALLAPRRSQSRRMATALIREGLADVLASDAHSAVSPRPPLLAEAYAVASTIDARQARLMVEDAPAAILAGEPLPQQPKRQPRRRLSLRRPR
jgi:protein-tyrosine phosphatase